jgi:hypothetical protein
VTPVAATPATEDLERLQKQNAQLLRALVRAKAERDALAAQLAALQLQSAAADAQVSR